jgi:Family of unknown function (DUF6186)
MNVTAVLWIVLAVAVALTVIFSPKRGIPRLGQLLPPLLARQVFRLAVFVAWMWVGWHAFAR